MKEIFRKGRTIIGFSIYDAFGAYILKEVGDIDFIVIGDSASMVLKGYEDVKHVTIMEMIEYFKTVKRIIDDKPVFIDLPYGTYGDMVDHRDTLHILRDLGVDGILVEGVYPKVIRDSLDLGLECIVHLGYMPKFDEYPRVIGEDDFDDLLRQVRYAEDLGCIAVKLELVKMDVARRIRESISIPVLGTGSGPYVDGHILVLYDFLGMTPKFKPRFVRIYIDIFRMGVEATRRLVRDILEGRYPDIDESYV